MNWFQSKTRFIEKPAVDPALVQKCLATDIDGLPIFDSVLTVIDVQMKIWQEGAPGVISDHARLAQHTGAVVALRDLTTSLRGIRAAGQKDD